MAKRKPVPEPEPLQAPSSLDKLAAYNAEVARGIVHTPEWDERMARLQAEFDAGLAQEAQLAADQHTWRRRQRINLKMPPSTDCPAAGEQSPSPDTVGRAP